MRHVLLISLSYAVLRRRTGVSESGRRLRVVGGHLPAGTSYSLTALTSLTLPQGFLLSTPRVATNTSYDFLFFIAELVAARHLTAGDVLICDNASIHFAAEIRVALLSVLAAAGVRLLFMPTYSPELNPCELLFAQLKGHVRAHRKLSRSLLLDVMIASASVTSLNIVAYYDKCINRFNDN